MLVYEVGAEIGPRRREGLQVDVFVGRERELAMLQRVVDGRWAAAGAVLSVTGDSGMGKTRLLRCSACFGAAGLNRVSSARSRMARTRRSGCYAIRCASC